MIQYHFEWDPYKAMRNIRKHGIKFEQATEVFKDPMAVSIYDDEHDEERWATIGRVKSHHLLVVVHSYQESDSNTVNIRIVSARTATKPEIRHYEQG